MLRISKTIENGRAVISLDGQLNTKTVSHFLDVLPLGDSSLKELVLDCKSLSYLSSAGIRAILITLDDMEGKGSFKLIHVTPPIMEIFEMTGLLDSLPIEPA